MKGTKNPLNIYKTWKYRKKNKKDNFPYYGIKARMGAFGSGKTLGSVDECINILEKYPKCTFISNTVIKKELKNPTYFFGSAEELVEILVKILDENNENGYLIFMDEMHVVLSDLFGSSNPIFLTYLSQLRKLGIYILGTCQLYNKCPKMIRDYVRTNGQIVFCGKFFPRCNGAKIRKHGDLYRKLIVKT